MSTLSVKLYTAKTLKDGTHPVRLRIYFGKERFITIPGLSAIKSQWDNRRKVFNSKHPLQEEYNARIRHTLQRAEKILTETLGNDQVFSFVQFKKLFLREDQKKAICVFLESYIDELLLKEKIGNMKKYKQLWSKLFKENLKRRDMLFSDIDYNFLNEFENELWSQKLNDKTVNFYFRTFKALINEAINRGYMNASSYPFKTVHNSKGYKMPKVANKYDPKPVNDLELQKLKNFDISKHPHLAPTFHMFIFMLKARGMNFVDLASLTHANIRNNRIHYVRAKTHKLYNIKLTEELRRLVDQYSGDKYLFPIIRDENSTALKRYNRIRKSLHVFNSQLKEIASILDIKTSLSSYTCRYTYTDQIINKSGGNVMIVQKALGHTSLSTTQHYILAHKDEEVDAYDAII